MTSARRYDPFAPAPSAFPERRLRRAGLDDTALAGVREAFAGMSGEERRELVRFVARNPDRVVRDRFAAGRTREELERLTVEQLKDRLEERPGGLSTAGRKAELVDRLLASYDGGTTGPAEVLQDAPEEPPPATAPDSPSEAATVDEAPPATPPHETPDAAPAPDTTTEETTDRG